MEPEIFENQTPESQEPEAPAIPEWQQHDIIQRQDGSFVITRNGHPYHVPNEGEWAELWAEVHNYALDHPDQMKAEIIPEPAPPSPEEQAAQAKQAVLAQLAKLDADSVRPLRAIVAGDATEDDRARLAALDVEAASLRGLLA